jgi:hypothetical protein
MRASGAMVCMVLLLVGFSAQATYLIDDFSSYTTPGSGSSATPSTDGWTMKPTTGTGALSYTETGLADVAGGSRTTTVTSSSSRNGYTTATMSTSGTLAGLSVDNYVRTSSTLSLLYNGDGSGLNADLSSPGLNMFRVGFETDELGTAIPTTMSITVSDGTHTSTVSQTWSPPGELPAEGVQDYDFLFSAFDPLINFNQIQSITFFYSSDRANDYRITYFGAVPEPISMVMLGCLGAGMAVARKIRRKKS